MSNWDGTVVNPTVFVENGIESWVLDSSGNPFVITKRYKMGFDLTPKAQKVTDAAGTISRPAATKARRKFTSMF